MDLDLIWGVKFGMVMREMVAGTGGIRILHYKLYFVTIIHYLSPLSLSLMLPILRLLDEMSNIDKVVTQFASSTNYV